MKEHETSFHFPVFTQKHVRNVCHKVSVLDQISFWQYLGFNRNKGKCNFHCVVMSMAMSQFLKFMNFRKTRKSRYLEKEPQFFFQIKRIY